MLSNTETFISKYKPYMLDDFNMNEKLLKVIHTLMEIDDLNMLFVGPSGCGKTSLLYALIREYYKIDKHANIPETNILFIHTLKEQGIHYFRNEMKSFCQSKCSIHGKKKMIVIDDLDTINEQGQQVFRNYIDKYYNNIHFISVCNNLQKVIESIQSRIHILQIQPPQSSDIRDKYETIVANEIRYPLLKIPSCHITHDAKEYVLQNSNHSMRILINYLEKFHIYGETIDREVCKKMCSNISTQQFDTYLNHLKDGNLKESILLVYNIYDFGYSVIDILDYFFSYLKQSTLLSENQKYRMIPLLCKYITIFNKIHEDGIELAIFTNEVYKIMYSNK